MRDRDLEHVTFGRLSLAYEMLVAEVRGAEERGMIYPDELKTTLAEAEDIVATYSYWMDAEEE